jgi:protein-S-isoprenylcysteine O-methyltransferase Ste14
MNGPEPIQLKIVAPPPVMYIGALLFGFAIHAAFPIWIFSTGYGHFIMGGFLFVLSAAFARWAFLTMRQFGTSANPKKPSEALATNGPFQFSRNPIYVAMTGLYVGLDFIVNSVWPLMLLPPLLLIMNWGVIRREERYLSSQFGEAYAAYKSRVRRWL